MLLSFIELQPHLKGFARAASSACSIANPISEAPMVVGTRWATDKEFPPAREQPAVSRLPKGKVEFGNHNSRNRNCGHSSVLLVCWLPKLRHLAPRPTRWNTAAHQGFPIKAIIASLLGDAFSNPSFASWLVPSDADRI